MYDMELTLDQLVKTIPLAWNDETRGNEKWDGSHIASGQCTVSALLIQRHCGGTIVRCEVGGEYSRTIHYFNELDHGVKIDVTGSQFLTRSPYRKFQKNPPEKLYIFADTWHRVDLLEYRVKDILRGW